MNITKICTPETVFANRKQCRGNSQYACVRACSGFHCEVIGDRVRSVDDKTLGQETNDETDSSAVALGNVRER